MARHPERFELPRWEGPTSRRLHGGGRTIERDRSAHGKALTEQADTVARDLQRRIDLRPGGIDPQLVFKIDIHSGGSLDQVALAAMGLQILEIAPTGALVVFPDGPTLEELRSRLRQYSGVDQGHAYPALTAIDGIRSLTREDRIGPGLAQDWPADGMTVWLDLELWHPGSLDGARRSVEGIRTLLRARGFEATDDYVGRSLCLIRVRCDTATLEELLRVDVLREADVLPSPSFDMRDVVQVALDEVIVEPVDVDDLPGIVVVDTGVVGGHPLLGPVLADAQSFPGGPGGDVDETLPGHGTAVAGIAAYGDFRVGLAGEPFRPTAALYSAQVLDSECRYDETVLAENQLRQVVEYFVRNYPQARVFNLSLGNSLSHFVSGRLQFRLAAALDEIAYEYREDELVFVVASGNSRFDGDVDDLVERYPRHLLDEGAGILDPATAAIAITAGGISLGQALPVRGPGQDWVVAGQEGWPSPFTRTGWGVDGSIKPEVVDYAGATRFGVPGLWAASAHAGVPTTARAFAPPEGRLFTTVAGTSFSAPRVANLAARLMRDFPGASSNLIRALVIGSASVPDDRPEAFRGLDPSHDDILRTYGYGQPSFERAVFSEDTEALLVAEGVLPLDQFHIYLVPPLPPNFRSAKGVGRLTVSLCFDPPTRHTRGDSYLGVDMQFLLFRNSDPADVREALRSWTPEQIKALDEDSTQPGLGSLGTKKLEMFPRRNRRTNGTAQRATAYVRQANWTYDEGPLLLAVLCMRKWAPIEIDEQRYAVTVSISHDNPEVEVFAQVQEQAVVYQRTRVQV